MQEKVILLIPLRFNDGTIVPQSLLGEILHELFDAYGGYTVAGEVEGAYRMASGAKQLDSCLEVWIAVESQDEALGRLRQRVARFGAMLGQEQMYFERTGAIVELISPEQKERHPHD